MTAEERAGKQKVELVKRPQSNPAKKPSALAKLVEKLSQVQVDRVIGIAERIVEARITAGLAEAETTNKIRIMMAKLRDDSKRCELAASYLDQMSEYLSDEERGVLASAIIKLQLGVPAREL